MNILFIANFLKDKNSGTAGYVIRLGEEFAERGHSADFIFAKDVPSLLPLKKEKAVLPLASFINFPIAVSLRIKELSAKKDYDAVHVSSGDGAIYFLIAGFFQKILGGKRPILIMASHGLEHIFYKELSGVSASKGIRLPLTYRLFMRLIRLPCVWLSLRLADAITCNSDTEASFINRRFGIARNKIFFLPQGADIAPGEKKHVYPPRKLLFVGSWVPIKGVNCLIRSYEKITEVFPDVVLTIVGSGFSAERVLSYFPDKIRAGVTVISRLDYQDMLAEYRKHDILLLTSVYDSFGRAVLEAMASGLPAVLTDGCGISEILENGKDALIVSKNDPEAFADAVMRLMKDELLYEMISKNARKKASGYTWKRTAGKLLEIIESAKRI